MAVLYDVQKDRSLFRIQLNKKEIIEDEQRATFYFLELCLDVSFCLGDFESSQQLRGIGVKRADAGLAGLVSDSRCKEAFPGSARAGNEQVLALPHLPRTAPALIASVRSTSCC